MAPSGSRFLLFDVHHDGNFNFMPLRYENGLVYSWSVPKDRELDIASACQFLREETQSIIIYELFFKLPQCELEKGLKIIENDMDLLAMYDYADSYVKSRRKTIIKDASNVSVEELVKQSARSRNSGIIIEENVNPSFSEDDDSHSDLDMEQMLKGNTDLEKMFK
ncbi:hypothetical protein Tco_1490133, partial [Tanacetum coccineum]